MIVWTVNGDTGRYESVKGLSFYQEDGKATIFFKDGRTKEVPIESISEITEGI